MSRRNLLAVNRAIADAGLTSRPEHAAVVQLARDCARRLDSVGTAEAPVTLLAEYRGALRDLRRAAKETATVTRIEKGSRAVRDSVEPKPMTAEAIALASGVPRPSESEQGLGWLGRRPDGLAIFRALQEEEAAAAKSLP